MHQKLPCPRLELMWTEEKDDRYDHDHLYWFCRYNLVLPLDDSDTRGNPEGDGPRKTELKIRIGFIKRTGGPPPVDPDYPDKMDTPFRDSTHIQIDNRSLGGHLPMFVTCGDMVNPIPKSDRNLDPHTPVWGEVSKLPSPRLELRDTLEAHPTQKGKIHWVCRYNLVLPLDELDCRGNTVGDEPRQTELTISLGKTSKGGTSPLFAGQIDNPIEYATYIQKDNQALGGNLPMYTICNDVIMLLDKKGKQHAVSGITSW